jgi:translocation and assembly module TamB
MPVDDRDHRSAESSEKTDQRPANDTGPAETTATLRRRRSVTRFLTRRHGIIGALAIIAGVSLLVLILGLVYRLGYIDAYVASQIKDTFAKYGIRAEIKEFHTILPRQMVEIQGIELFDAATGEKLGRIARLDAAVRIRDLYAVDLQRHLDLTELKIEGLEVWVKFDDQGDSNFRNIHIPPPETNHRILLSYTTAHIEIKSGVIHYGDARHELSGEARNLSAAIEPYDTSAPAESQMHPVTFAVSNSTFTYDDRPLNDIGVQMRARVNETRAEIQELVLRSPVAEARLQGTMDDWRALRYQMTITSTVDLTQLSEVLQAGTALRGAGNFSGTVSGEGERYKVEGSVKSDTLAADGVRLQGLNVTAAGSGQGKTYALKGRAVAELLAAGDFQLNSVQLIGGVMGTGSDFRWIGELRAAAEKNYGTTIAGLILHDARAEMNEGVLTASSTQFTANGLASSGAKAGGITASNLRLRVEHKVTTGTVANIKANEVIAADLHVKDISANNIEISGRNDVTGVNIKELLIGGLNAAGAEVGSLNIAGVRLSVRAGRIEGSTAEINTSVVKLAAGQINDLKLARPVFVVEPSGRYRASADLSIGGGVLGQMNMGQARAAVVATNNEVQLSDFTVDIFNGRANGAVTISRTNGGASHVVAAFSNLEIALPILALSQKALPLAGKASGSVDLVFPDTDFKKASGSLNTQFVDAAVDAKSDRTPISGAVALHAINGLFQIERVDLQTATSHLKATGQFSFAGGSELQVDLNSTDASELQSVFVSSGFLGDVEDRMNEYGIELAGRLAFNGAVRGQLTDPSIEGRVSLGSLLISGRDVGALAASFSGTPVELRITNGQLTEPDGGGIQFTLNAPRVGENNIALEATLDRMNAANLTALPFFALTAVHNPGAGVLGGLGRKDIESDLSGKISIAGIPGAMLGSADLRFGKGHLAAEPFDSIVARATFNGANANLENVDARFEAGHITATGTFNTATKIGDLKATGQAIQLDRLVTLAGKSGLPKLTGTADLNAHISGNFLGQDFSSYQITFDGQGSGVAIGGQPVKSLELRGRTEDQKLKVTFKTDWLGQPQLIVAGVDLANEQLPATIDAQLSDVDLTKILAMALPNAGVKLTGRVTAAIKVSGNLVDEDGEFSLAGLRGAADFTELAFRAEEMQLTAVTPFTVRLAANEVEFDRTQFTGTGTNIVLDGAVAIREGGKESLSAEGRLNLRVLNSLSPDLFLSGTGDVFMRVSGTYEQPRMNGTATLAGASLAVLVANDRWQISNLKSVLRLSADQAQIESLTGTLGGGHISVSGGALLDGFSISRFSLHVHAGNATVPFPKDFRSTLDADLDFGGTSKEQVISGAVNLRRAEYTKDIELADLINRRREESIEEGGEIPLVHTTQFGGLRVEGRNALVVRNNLADLIGSVSLQINGPVKDPLIAGRITATSGTMNFRNDRYDIARAVMDLPPRRNADPLLNVQGESQIRGYRIIVNLTGPLSQPQASVRSEPALPQADVVSLITTGSLASGDSGTSVLAQSGLGTATSLLTDALINAPAQRATNKLFGLSRFEISPVIGGRTGSNPGARLTVGKRISKEMSVNYSTNVTSDPNQILAVEYRVSDRLSFVALYEQASTRQISSRNNGFSFEIRFRKRF